MTQPIPIMPDANMTRNAEVLARVMERHGLSQADLADLSGYSESMISRVCSGQYAVPAQMFIALMRVTKDDELRDHLCGSDSRGRTPGASLYADAMEIQQRAHAVAETIYILANIGGMHKADAGFLNDLGNKAHDLATRLSGIASRARTSEMQAAATRLPREGVVA